MDRNTAAPNALFGARSGPNRPILLVVAAPGSPAIPGQVQIGLPATSPRDTLCCKRRQLVRPPNSEEHSMPRLLLARSSRKPLVRSRRTLPRIEELESRTLLSAPMAVPLGVVGHISNGPPATAMSPAQVRQLYG